MKETLDSLWMVQKKYRELLQKMTRTQNLTIAEWALLRTISNGATTQQELVEKSLLDVSTLSRQLNKLVEKQMISFQKIPGTFPSKKKHSYRLTPMGQSAITDLDIKFQQIREHIFLHWSDEEENLLKILLNRLAKSLER